MGAIPRAGRTSKDDGESKKKTQTSDDLQKTRWQVCIRTGTHAHRGGGPSKAKFKSCAARVPERACVCACVPRRRPDLRATLEAGPSSSNEKPCRDRRGAVYIVDIIVRKAPSPHYSLSLLYVELRLRVNVWTTTADGWGLEQVMKSGPPGVQLTTALPFPFPPLPCQARPGSRPCVSHIASHHQTSSMG